MTNILAKAQMTQERLRCRVGHTEKNRHITVAGEVAAAILIQDGLTINYQPEAHEDVGARNIWQWIGFQHALRDDMSEIPNPSYFQRVESAQKHWKTIRQGFKSLKDNLFEDHHLMLYMVPRHQERKKVEVITLDSDFKVNEVETATEVALQVMTKRQRERLRAALESSEAMTGNRCQFALRVQEILSDLASQRLAPAMMALPLFDETEEP